MALPPQPGPFPGEGAETCHPRPDPLCLPQPRGQGRGRGPGESPTPLRPLRTRPHCFQQAPCWTAPRPLPRRRCVLLGWGPLRGRLAHHCPILPPLLPPGCHRHDPVPSLPPSPFPVGTQSPTHPPRAGGPSSVSLTTDLSTAGSGAPSHHLPDSVQPECAHVPPFQQPPPSPSPGHPESPNLTNRAPEAQGRPADMTPPCSMGPGWPPPGRAVRATAGAGRRGPGRRQTRLPGAPLRLLRCLCTCALPPPALGVAPHTDPRGQELA